MIFVVHDRIKTLINHLSNAFKFTLRAKMSSALFPMTHTAYNSELFHKPLLYFYLFILNIWSKYISEIDWCESIAIFYVARDRELGFGSHLICILLTKRACIFALLVLGMHSDAVQMCSDAISNFRCATKPNTLTPAK